MKLNAVSTNIFCMLAVCEKHTPKIHEGGVSEVSSCQNLLRCCPAGSMEIGWMGNVGNYHKLSIISGCIWMNYSQKGACIGESG